MIHTPPLQRQKKCISLHDPSIETSLLSGEHNSGRKGCLLLNQFPLQNLPTNLPLIVKGFGSDLDLLKEFLLCVSFAR